MTILILLGINIILATVFLLFFTKKIDKAVKAYQEETNDLSSMVNRTNANVDAAENKMSRLIDMAENKLSVIKERSDRLSTRLLETLSDVEIVTDALDAEREITIDTVIEVMKDKEFATDLIERAIKKQIVQSKRHFITSDHYYCPDLVANYIFAKFRGSILNGNPHNFNMHLVKTTIFYLTDAAGNGREFERGLCHVEFEPRVPGEAFVHCNMILEGLIYDEETKDFIMVSTKYPYGTVVNTNTFNEYAAIESLRKTLPYERSYEDMIEYFQTQ